MNPVLGSIFKALPSEDQKAATDIGAEEITKRLKKAEELMVSQSAEVKGYVEELETNKREGNAARDAKAAAITNAAEATTIVATEKANLVLKTENAVIDAVGDSADVNYLSELMTEIRTEASALDDLYDQARDISNEEVTGIGFLDTIISNTRIKMMQPKIDAHKAALLGTQNELTSVANATESIYSIQNNTKRTVNNEIIAANNEVVKAKAEQELSNNEVERAASNSQDVARIFGMKGEELKNAMAAVRLAQAERSEVTEQERIKLQRKQQELTEKRIDLDTKNLERVERDSATRSELLELDLAEKKRQIEQAKVTDPLKVEKLQTELSVLNSQLASTRLTEQDIAIRVNKAEAALGLPLTSSATLRERFSAEKGTELGTRWRDLYLMGGGEGESVQIGTSPFDALTTVSKLSPNGVPANLQSSGLKLAEQALVAMSNKIDTRTQKRIEPKTAQEAEALFNATLSELINDYTSNIKADDYSNPYHAPPLSVITEYSEAVKNSAFYTKVLSNAEGVKDANPDKLLTMGAAAVNAGTIKAEEVVDGIELIFDTAVQYNNSINGGFERYNIAPQSSYKSVVKPADNSSMLSKVGGFLVDRTVVGGVNTTTELIKGPEPTVAIDFTSPVEIENMLTKYIVNTPAATNYSEDNN
ncbi:MAG: hypothetical protein CMK07_13495 [Ponticaulis sp.]|nr:hypothetical protein [Ponticaulis sp.]|tara:strand:+ start:1207 stop:3156 length:1950 start_codon:yes stop_codon:yes gene_type:complete